MKLSRLTFGVLLLTFIPLINSCESPPTHILYITDLSCVVRDADGNIIDPLWLFPGDIVVWVNSSDREVTVKYEDAAVFGVEEWTIAAGKRKILTVEKGVSGTYDYVITPCEDPPGAPKTKIGDDP